MFKRIFPEYLSSQEQTIMIWCSGTPVKICDKLVLLQDSACRVTCDTPTLFVEFHAELSATDFVNIVR
jgi:hypothetical protein